VTGEKWKYVGLGRGKRWTYGRGGRGGVATREKSLPAPEAYIDKKEKNPIGMKSEDSYSNSPALGR